jgi:hypothetical protein
VTKLSRLLVGAASLLLLGMFLFPIWRIDLTAPQHPEGLGMRIRINTIVGTTEHTLTNINNLNHYIGMKPIVPDSIPELKLMPWLVGAIIAFGLVTAAVGRRRVLYAWVAAFALLALAGLADFWWWEYDYGHNLDFENAIIEIPGMSYQPPLIGTKQLANFTASSWPALGGGLAFVSFALAAFALVHTLRAQRAARAARVPASAPARERSAATPGHAGSVVA